MFSAQTAQTPIKIPVPTINQKSPWAEDIDPKQWGETNRET